MRSRMRTMTKKTIERAGVRFLKAKGVTLKTCPFCGGPGQIMAKDLRTQGFMRPQEKHGTKVFYFIGCHNAPCQMQPKITCQDKDRGVQTWNTREEADDV